MVSVVHFKNNVVVRGTVGCSFKLKGLSPALLLVCPSPRGYLGFVAKEEFVRSFVTHNLVFGILVNG